jgi:hypothetical protein
MVLILKAQCHTAVQYFKLAENMQESQNTFEISS